MRDNKEHFFDTIWDFSTEEDPVKEPKRSWMGWSKLIRVLADYGFDVLTVYLLGGSVITSIIQTGTLSFWDSSAVLILLLLAGKYISLGAKDRPGK